MNFKTQTTTQNPVKSCFFTSRSNFKKWKNDVKLHNTAYEMKTLSENHKNIISLSNDEEMRISKALEK